MRKRDYLFAYIDGFAGTGYHELKQEERDGGARLFPEAEEPEVEAFLDGSARVALQVEPRFSKYIFIEKNRKKAAELEKLKTEFPDKSGDITIGTAEANGYLQKLCKSSWKKHRAVLFIDPFGMQLSWDTLKAVAETKAIDTWILFPVSAVNRLLKKDGKIRDSWRRCLDTMFGDPGWFDVFFQKKGDGLFGGNPGDHVKATDIKRIGKYFNERLASIFAGVAPNPLLFSNSKGAPLFLLCFAAANPNAAPTAIRIAKDILKRDPGKTPRLPSLDECK
jgi:three-Cys-motif partner protein